MPLAAGVAAAVVEAIKHIDPSREVQIEYGDGLRECKKMLMMAKAGKRNGYLLEGMACPGGCVAGAGTITPVRESTMNVEKFKKEAAEGQLHCQPLCGPSERRGGITGRSMVKKRTPQGVPLLSSEKAGRRIHS